ncbi:uncharacterized protein LOC144631429 [Oculina patagonica]
MLRGLTPWGRNRNLFSRIDVLRPVLQARIIMVSDGDVVERLEKRAVEAEETIALLKSQLVFLQKAAEKKSKSGGIKDRISALKQENERLKQEADKLKSELEYWEVRNGLKQISLPILKQGAPSGAQQKVDIPATEQAEVKPEKQQEEKPAQKKAKKEKVEKKGKDKKPDAEGSEPPSSSEPDVSRIDFRVGKILSAKHHPDADTLFVEEIDVGEETPRTVCSGLVGSVPLEELQDRVVIVMCNLKPVKMRGITSQAMVMCAVSEDRKFFELLDPPNGSVPGDRVVFDGFPGEPDRQLNPKKKVWDQVKPHLLTNDAGVACYKDVPFTVPGKGVCTSRKLFKAPIS